MGQGAAATAIVFHCSVPRALGGSTSAVTPAAPQSRGNSFIGYGVSLIFTNPKLLGQGRFPATPSVRLCQPLATPAGGFVTVLGPACEPQ